jgi:hypothetical protein
MLDEAAAVACRKGLRAQPHFKKCEGAGGSEPSLCYDDGDGNQVREAEPQRVDPAPGAEVADDRENKASDDERDDGEVEREHRIREQLVQHVVAHLRCLTFDVTGRKKRNFGPSG